MAGQHRLDPTILREYDIRGIVGETLSTDDVTAIGCAFGTLAISEGCRSVAVGYDGRLSSPDLEAAVVAGLMATGLHVDRVGLGPSPMLYFATHYLQTDAGVMITGSHNPPDYNGLKLTLKGRAFFGDDIQALGACAASGEFIVGTGSDASHDIAEAYIERLLQDLDMDDLAVAWDPGNGAAGDVVKVLTDRMPGRHTLINATIDGTFPAHHPDPTVEANLAQLKAVVAEEGCDLGIGFDGDGDRIGVIDAHGRVIWGDQLLVLLAAEVLRDHPGATIICDIKGSRIFTDEITRMGGVPMLWKAGHSHIKSKMVEVGAPLAGEMSAHIFFKHRYYGYDDALYAAVRLLSGLKRRGASLAELLDALPKTVATPEVRFDCAENRKFAVIEEARVRLAGDKNANVLDIDGVRVETADGWWLLRASNTQAALVVRCESATPDGLDRLKQQVAAQLRESGIEPPSFS